MAGRKRKRYMQLNILGLMFFLAAIPLFFRMGGGRYVLAEVLPGQAADFPLSGSAEALPVLGSKDIRFVQATEKTEGAFVAAEELEKMQNISYLKSHYYIIDSRTDLLAEDIDPKEALGLDLSITADTDEPKILIFHTHSHEGFRDSDMSKGLSEGIWGVGEELKRILEEEYGIGVVHDSGRYDVVDGKTSITGAYERMEPAIREILQKYPSIEVVIDLHRDGVPESTRLVTEIDGKSCAKVMFFNGLCRLNKNGSLQKIEGLENPYLKENLAFSLQMKTAADSLYPDFSRKIYLNAYRFSLHLLPRSTLIEVGAQTNTKEEAKNAMRPLAKILAETLLK